MGLFSEMSIAYNSFKKAHAFIRKHNLWHFVLIPGVLNLVFFITLLIWLVKNVGFWVDSFFNWECNEEEGITYLFCITFYSAIIAIKYLIVWFVKAVFIMFYLLVYKNIILIIYSPFIAFLIEKVDQKNKGIELPFYLQQFIKDTVRGVKIALRNILIELLCVIFILLITLIPIINLFQPILFWVVSAYFIGFSMMDYSLERKQLTAKSSVDYIKSNKSMAMGIGSVFQLMYFVPLIGWMFAPTYAAVAAYFSIEELERIKAE